MRANDISEEKNVYVFLSEIGADHYKLLKNLVSLTVPSAMPYADLVRALNTHYKPSPIIIAERLKQRQSHRGKWRLSLLTWLL